MLDLHSGIFAIQETGANIGPTVSIPAQPHTAARTIQYTSAWCVLQYLPTTVPVSPYIATNRVLAQPWHKKINRWKENDCRLEC